MGYRAEDDSPYAYGNPAVQPPARRSGSEALDARLANLTETFSGIARATTADELLTALAHISPDNRYTALSVCGVKILCTAADLCGVGDADTLTKRQAIKAITENF